MWRFQRLLRATTTLILILLMMSTAYKTILSLIYQKYSLLKQPRVCYLYLKRVTISRAKSMLARPFSNMSILASMVILTKTEIQKIFFKFCGRIFRSSYSISPQGLKVQLSTHHRQRKQHTSSKLTSALLSFGFISVR